MHVIMYDWDNVLVIGAEWYDPYPHYTEIFYGRTGDYGGFDEIKSPSLETWGATERR